MAKTKLTNEKRDAIVAYMTSRYDAKEDHTARSEAYALLVTLANTAVRAKYPEADMSVFRKYPGASRVDYCLNFQDNDTGRYVRIEFDRTTEALADIPCTRGCYSHDTFPAPTALIATYDGWKLLADLSIRTREAKVQEYRSFVLACKTVEDVEATVPLPADLRQKLTGSNTSLVAVSDEIIADLRAEFAEAA